MTPSSLTAGDVTFCTGHSLTHQFAMFTAFTAHLNAAPRPWTLPEGKCRSWNTICMRLSGFQCLALYHNVQTSPISGCHCYCIVLRNSIGTGGGGDQAYSRLSTNHGHITDCKLVSVVDAGVRFVLDFSC